MVRRLEIENVMREPVTTADRISYIDVNNVLVIFDIKIRCACCTKCLANSVTGRCYNWGPFNKNMEVDLDATETIRV